MRALEAIVRYDTLDDTELVRRARANDRLAFREIIQRHNRRLYRLVRSMLKDEADAEDAVQEIYLHAFARLGEFRGESALSTWLTRIAVNEALMRLRCRRETAELTEETMSATIVTFPLPVGQNPEEVAARSQISRVLEAAIDELPDGFRTVFVLRTVEQLSTEETAAALGIPEDTVKTRLFRARRLLRTAIGDQFASALTGVFPFAGARCARITEAVMAELFLPNQDPDQGESA
jgi:RNA polymerase sigma-70 factor (ECF subfamily)